MAHLGRALYARRRGRAAAVAIVSGWLIAVAGAVVAANVAPAERVVAGIGLAHSVGMLVAGALLIRAVHVDAGTAALAGLARTFGLALGGGVIGAAAGVGLAIALPELDAAATVAAGVVVALVAAGTVLGALWLGCP